jgi:hypothetical protein
VDFLAIIHHHEARQQLGERERERERNKSGYGVEKLLKEEEPCLKFIRVSTSMNAPKTMKSIQIQVKRCFNLICLDFVAPSCTKPNGHF